MNMNGSVPGVSVGSLIFVAGLFGFGYLMYLALRHEFKVGHPVQAWIVFLIALCIGVGFAFPVGGGVPLLPFLVSIAFPVFFATVTARTEFAGRHPIRGGVSIVLGAVVIMVEMAFFAIRANSTTRE